MDKINNELIDPPIEPAGEKAHRVARIMIGAVPILGGAGVEIFNSVIDTPMNERKAQWMNQVGNALNDLIEKGVDRVPGSGVTEPAEGALRAKEVGHRGSWLTLSLRRPNTHQRNHDDQAHYRIDRVG